MMSHADDVGSANRKITGVAHDELQLIAACVFCITLAIPLARPSRLASLS
jgi:hypothetical protein